MIYMGTAGNGGWAERGRRIAASPHAPAVAGALLGLAAMTEAIARGADTGMSVASLVGVCALAAWCHRPAEVHAYPRVRERLARLLLEEFSPYRKK